VKRFGIFISIAAAGLTSALALAQSQESPPNAERATTPGSSDTAPLPAPRPRYIDLRRITPILGYAEAGRAKSEVCAACHGPQGIAITPAFPNLAGQRADFLYWQLVQFKRGRTESPMAPLVAELGEPDMRDLAAYYASLTPARTDATGPSDATQLQRGEQLFLSGDPAKGIPPCKACHGVDARGHPNAAHRDRGGYTPYAAYPALRGQQAMYLQAKLAEYRNGKLHDSTTDFVMSGVAQRLDDGSVQALSAWLSHLPP
jgi:cytochrome c553